MTGSEVMSFVICEVEKLGLQPNEELTVADVFVICMRLQNLLTSKEITNVA